MENEEFKLGELILLETYPTKLGKRRKARYKCFCGKEFEAAASDVKIGHTKSCGCYGKYKRRKSRLKHGDKQRGKKTRLYGIWIGMNNRCNNTKHKQYNDYGGRGIKVCEDWKNDFISFKKWATSNGYADHLTIDRKENHLGYSPDNCRWVTHQTQNINQRLLRKDNTTGYRGVTVQGNKFQTSINYQKIRYYIGLFDTLEEAALAYNKKALELFGMEAKLNKLPSSNL